MTKNLHASTQALIQDIERKDQRFRIAQSIFLAAIMLFMALTVALGYVTLTSSQRQTIELERKIKQVDSDNAAKLQNLQNHIDCIVTLFTQPNRLNLTISDISTCQLQAINGGASGSPRSTVAPAQSAPASKAPTASNTPTQAAQPTPTSTPAPAPHPALCKATLGLLGCK